MKRKIIGIFVIALLTISYMPLVTGDASQVSEEGKSEVNKIGIFFRGEVYLMSMSLPNHLPYLGIFLDIESIWITVGEKNLFMADGKIKHLDSLCCLRLYHFTGIGTPIGVNWMAFKYFINPDAKQFLMGFCDYYKIVN